MTQTLFRFGPALALALTLLALAGLGLDLGAEPARALRAPEPPAPRPAATSEAARRLAEAPGAILAPELKARMRAAPDVALPVVFLLRRPASPAEGPDAARARFASTSAPLVAALEAEARAGRAGAPQPLWLAGAVAASVQAGAIERLVERPELGLRWVGLDPELRLPAPVAVRMDAAGYQARIGTEAAPRWNLRQIRAPEVWELLGIDGGGVTVAVIDTGVDYHHPLLQTRYRGFRPDGPPRHAGNWWCSRGEDALCSFGDTYPVDGHGHGTHVLGSILGQDGVGVAPGASWIAARACVNETCRFSWIVDALGWLVELGDRAPDIVNLSLGTDDEIERMLFEPVIARVVEAGIVVVAATGNAATSGSVGNLRAPASFTSTIGVGATRESGEVWHLSARGISRWWETKPDLVAPGVRITSTLPGGGLGLDTGTSMATPHVAGVAALLLQARPELTPAEVKEILERSARPLGEQRPDAAAGWGLVDAYAAVSSVLDVGQLRGRVVRIGDTKPITWAQVTVADSLGDPLARVGVATDDGSFKVDLPAGDYLVIANAFGFRTGTERGVTLRTGQETQVELALEVDEPMGIFEGRITEAVSETSLAARIELEGVPFPVTSDETTGFSQRLPAGEYGLRIAKFGYRVITDSITVKAGETLHRDYRLEAAPRILLVDGDAWNYSSAIDSYRASLDRLGYVYHEHAITDEWAGPGKPGGPPLAETLADYDIVIWASPVSSPNQTMGAWELLAYLERGGRLFLSGQDALCNDAGRDMAGKPCNQNAPPHPYLRDKLKLRVLEDFADQRGLVRGLPGGPLEGLTLTLNGPGSLDNQVGTDVVEVVAPQHARLVAAYPGGQGAGVLADTCLAHRALALGFGFEGIAGAAMRDRVMQRILDALMAPPLAEGLYAAPDRASLVRSAGATADYTITLHNLGAEAVDYRVEVDAADWPAELWDAGFGGPFAGSLRLGSCRSGRLGLRVRVPEGAPHGAEDEARLRIAWATGSQTLGLRTQAPAPVLVVDGDYAGESEGPYLAALDAAGLRYDHWELGLLRIQPRLPTTETLRQYPMVIWFTGENLLHPERNFGTPDQLLVADYLDAGGRLLLSSEDYLYHWGETPFLGDRLFHEDYLGVARYVDNGGAAHQGPIAGEPGSLLDGLEGCRLTPRRADADFSDRVEALDLPGARIAMRNAFGQPIGVQNARAGGFATLFLGFDLGHAEPACVASIIGRAVDGFSPLAASALELIDAGGQPERRRTFGSGDRLRLRLRVKHGGPREAKAIDLRWSLPEGASVDPAALPVGLRLQGRELQWQGALPRFGEQVFTIELQLAEDLPAGATMRSEAWLRSDGVRIARQVEWQVNAPDIRRSSKSVPDRQRDLAFGDSTTFVVNVVNSGTLPLTRWTITDTLPAGLSLVEGSWLSEHGLVEQLGPRRLVWRGAGLPEGSATSLTYSAQVVTRDGGWLTNRAELVGPAGEPMLLEASVFARPQLLLPWLGWQLLRDP